MKRGYFIISLLGAIAGGLIMIMTIGGANSAPQEAAGYAMACAFAVVPYVLARSLQMMSDENDSREQRQLAASEATKQLLEEIKQQLKKEDA